MTKPLVVVESPTKVRTIQKYLGKEYNVAATVGHIKDLPRKEMGIDIEKDFTPQYGVIPGKSKVITSLKKAAGDTKEVYLAPDPDREGEAIAWHTAEVLRKKGRTFHRVLFHELTPRAISEAMARPAELNRSRYEAQQARRILDRLVGYQISPLLWRKVKGGLSAGRVQSVAVRIICERERQIQAFEPEEYWSITAKLQGEQPPAFEAKLTKQDGKKIRIPNKASADAILQALGQHRFVLNKIHRRTVRKNPLPPFITSKLQQEAIRKLRFTAKKTMTVAQQLYEGIEIGPGEPTGLITYMRTDSTRISEEAAQEALGHIRQRFGKDYAQAKPRFFKNKNKAQDAHEAIRPTAVDHTPEKLEPYLTRDQLALYRLIWQRFVASQMTQALIDQKSLRIQAGPYEFTASGSTVRFPGFMTLYMSVDDEADRTDENGKGMLPELKEGETLQSLGIEPKQHFTLPPPRFSEASLVKELEENGIGRPSTYAAILSTIRDKGYVDLIKRYFHPTELGFIVNDLLVKNFPTLFDVDFTARMEGDLDRIEAEEEDYQQLLRRFYGPFRQNLESASDGMLSMRGVGMPTPLKCPRCGEGRLHIKVGKNGEYLACNRYPDCRFTRNYTRDDKGRIHPAENSEGTPTDKVCEKCGSPMLIKQGRYGEFLACSGYPDCKNTQSLSVHGGGTGVSCPEADCDGELVEKRSKRGKVFFGCNRYPDCSYAVWDKPVPKPCPSCGNPFLLEKTTKKAGTFLQCPDRQCGHRESAPEEE
ncbi:MAG: type I DNA topoisomerase [Desulfobacteraceae bacterium]|nr:type I DNA topoisomerase [Desulfobacteraceae bacterium]